MLEQWQQQIESYLGFLDQHIFIRALAIFLISWVLAWLLDRVIITSIARYARKTSAEFDDHLIGLLHRPVFSSLLIIGAASALFSMHLEASVQSVILSLLIMTAMVIWTAFLLRLSRLVLRSVSSNPDHVAWLHPQSLPLFENIAYMAIIAIAIYYIFSLWHVDMTAWLASAGIVGIAVGFAAKDTLSNVFSGVFILADAPYKIGDFVVLDAGERGEITKIGLRSTRMLTRDDIEVTIPNAIMGNSKIINESGGPYEKFRIRVQVGVAYGSDIDLVRTILMDVAQKDPAVCNDPEPRVRLRQFGTSSLNFELLCWIDQPVLRGRIIDSLNCGVYNRFIAEGVEIPYTKQDLYIKELPQSLQRRD